MILSTVFLLLLILSKENNAYINNNNNLKFKNHRMTTSSSLITSSLLSSSMPSIPSIESVVLIHDNINTTTTTSKLRLLVDTITLTKVQLEKEASRKFRRTVFNAKDWEKHRSPTRYVNSLFNAPRSVILRGLTSQALGVTIVSFLICLYNILIEKLLANLSPNPWYRWIPIFSHPPIPWTLTSPSLGLLLVFRTNAAYSRWCDSRISWATVSSKTFDVMRQGLNWITDKRLKAELVRHVVCFSKSLKWWLGNQDNPRRLKNDLVDLLTADELDNIMKSPHPVQYSLMKISSVVSKGDLFPNIQTHIDRYICELSNALYVCDRIFTTPIPLLYTRHTARFLLLWLLTLPMALYHELNSPWRLIQIPVISFFTSIFLFGIEDLGVQIEEPFSILPLAEICLGINATGTNLLENEGIDWFEGVQTNTTNTINVSNNTTTPSFITNISEGINELISIEIRDNSLLALSDKNTTNIEIKEKIETI